MTTTGHAKKQAKAQLESIKEMVAALNDAGDGSTLHEEALQAIYEDPLSVEVRSGWHTPGVESTNDGEYMILLCTGGPACRIRGELDNWYQPVTAILEYQDWFTPWVEYDAPDFGDVDREALLTYAAQFYYED